MTAQQLPTVPQQKLLQLMAKGAHIYRSPFGGAFIWGLGLEASTRRVEPSTLHSLEKQGLIRLIDQHGPIAIFGRVPD